MFACYKIAVNEWCRFLSPTLKIFLWGGFVFLTLCLQRRLLFNSFIYLLFQTSTWLVNQNLTGLRSAPRGRSRPSTGQWEKCIFDSLLQFQPSMLFKLLLFLLVMGLKPLFRDPNLLDQFMPKSRLKVWLF